MRILKTIRKDVWAGENIEIYLIVLFSIGLVILDILDIAKQEWIFSITMSIMAIVAISLLGNRRKIEKMAELINESPSAVFIKKYPDTVNRDFSEANELWLLGVNLASTSHTYFELFRENLHQGKKIKVLLVDPNGVANELCAYRNASGTSPEWHRREILRSLISLSLLKENSSENIEIRTIDYIPSFGFYGINLDSPSGVLYSEHYGFKLTQGDLPRLVLRPSDGEWYELFKSQLYIFWNAGKDWTYSSSETEKMIYDQKTASRTTL